MGNQPGGLGGPPGAGGKKPEQKKKKKKFERKQLTRVGKKVKRGPPITAKIPEVAPRAECKLRKMKLEIIRDMKDGLRDVRLEVQGLSEKVAVKAAEEAVMESTTAKGFEYEDVVHDWVARATAGHGDLAEMVGTSAGSAACGTTRPSRRW